MKLKLVGKTALKFADKHLPEILSAMALIGLGGAVVRATSRAGEAVEALNDAKIEKVEKLERLTEDETTLDIYKGDNGEYNLKLIKLNPWEWFKAEAPVYWDTWLITLASGACIVLSNRVSARRYAALFAAFSLNEKKLKEYREKAKELFGEKKAEQIEDEIIKDKVLDMPEEVKRYYDSGKQFPCYLNISDDWFIGNRASICNAFNKWNAIGVSEGEVTLEDLAGILDIPVKDPTYYQTHIWSFSNYDRDALQPMFYDCSTIDGTPAIGVKISRDYDRIVSRLYN